MKIITLNDVEEIYNLASRPYNVPDDKNWDAFKKECEKQWVELCKALSAYGSEGDFYGVSDFAIRPSRKGPYDASRQFTIVVLKKSYEKSDYLRACVEFVAQSKTDYRVWIDRDYDQRVLLSIIITKEEGLIYCESEKEGKIISDKLQKIIKNI